MISREEAKGILSNIGQNAANILAVMPKSAEEKVRALMNEIEALDMAIEDMQKQIPKKPVKIGEEYFPERQEWVVDYECPSCGNPYADDSYCSCCGQALDWGDS